jgi:hypothetical protein
MIDSEGSGQGQGERAPETRSNLGPEEALMKDFRTNAKPRKKLLLRVAGVALVVAPGCGGSTADLGDQHDAQTDAPIIACNPSMGRCVEDAGPVGSSVVDAGLSINDGGPPVGLGVADAGPSGDDAGVVMGTVVTDAGPSGDDAGDDAGVVMGTVVTDAGPSGDDAGDDGGPVGRFPEDAGDATLVGLGVADAGQGD